MNQDLVDFAEQVRRKAHALICAAHNEGATRTSLMAAELCTLAANIANQEQMSEETAGADRYDLALLPAPSPE